MSETISGYIEKIVFRNTENGYTVFSLSTEDDDFTCVGSFTFLNEGEYIEVTGEMMVHPMYGEQIKVESYEVKEPQDLFSVERYLGSGTIKGIGPALASRIVKKFQTDTFRIIEEEPERLSEVKGISERLAKEIAVQFEEKREMRGALLFLQQYGISNNLATKIFKQYGSNMYEIMKENPYRLADDIYGVGFKLADEIAAKVGIEVDSDYRIQAGILHVLLKASNNGHVYLPKEELLEETANMLEIDISFIEKHIMDMIIDKRIIGKEMKDGTYIYNAMYYYMELSCAKKLLDLNITYEMELKEVEKRIRMIEQQESVILDERQRSAVLESVKNGLLVITGGPGTGKTTTINTIIRFFESEGMEILLAAPTGRAAKRMSETTGRTAQTIHRLLEISGAPEEESKAGMRFERNETNPLEADVIIIDEVSMVDIHLLSALLKAILVGTRLILVGDVNQLPSVGPGNVLKDIILAHQFHVVMLTKIFRQAAESDIIVNAHKINRGEQIELNNKSKDFFLLQRVDVNVIISVMIQLISQKLPKYVNTTPYDIQVLTPMRKGELGVERLNQVLQQYMNPFSREKKEKECRGILFREGDKVMQVKNNYKIEWKIQSKYGITAETGSGVFNGDCGVIKEINLFSETVTVEFEEGKLVVYPFNGLEELDLAYAITIHKSQGSEYPAVVIPILTGPRMLFNRNLLYTAVTRAKYCVIIVGSKQMVQYMIDNVNEQKRYSTLRERILELSNP